MSLNYALGRPVTGQPTAYFWLNVAYNYKIGSGPIANGVKKILYLLSLNQTPTTPGVVELASSAPCISSVAQRNTIAGGALCSYFQTPLNNGRCDLFFNGSIRNNACKLVLGYPLQTAPPGQTGRYCATPAN